MHVSRFFLLPIIATLALPIEKRIDNPVVEIVEAVLPAGVDGAGGTVLSGLPNNLGTANDVVKTVLGGTPNQVGSTKDLVSTTVGSVLPGGAPGTVGGLFAGLNTIIARKRGLLG